MNQDPQNQNPLPTQPQPTMANPAQPVAEAISSAPSTAPYSSALPQSTTVNQSAIYQQQVTPRDTALPGKGLAIAGFIVALLSIVMNIFTIAIPSVLALILSIMGRVTTKRQGQPSKLALAGIIIASISGVLTLVVYGFLAYGAVQMAAQCNNLGPGVHTTGSTTITCDQNSKVVK